MHFLVDAQLPPGLVRLFEGVGEQAVHVSQIGMLEADDRTIAEHAKRTGMIIVTKDDDFVQMHYVEVDAPRVLWMRVGNVTNRQLEKSLGPRLAQVVSAFAAGERLVEVG